jgi:feruloyl-CoA synthase
MQPRFKRNFSDHLETKVSQIKYRALKFGIDKVKVNVTDQGVTYLEAEQALAPYPNTITERFIHWANTIPDATMFAQRKVLDNGQLGEWDRISYQQALQSAKHIGQALLNRGLNSERPVLILSENSLDHALMALACIYVGIPYCPTSPAYSTISQDFEKLHHIIKTLTPGLVFAVDGDKYQKAISNAVSSDTEVVLSKGNVSRPFSKFSELLATPISSDVDEAQRNTGPQTIVKFLFTSGSTKQPKAVINTQKMWCANQQQMAQSMPVLANEHLTLVDWLPWNHTFGGNHNFGMVIYNGGTLYIDDGKPTPALIHETLRNLREISPTVYFNVPSGFESIANNMKTDDVLRKTLLAKVKMFFFAGASLAQPIWDSLFESAEKEVGERIVMGTGLGMTESGPFAIFVTNPDVREGDLGVPTAGLTLKLVPSGDKTEVRYKGPNITEGYWRSPQETLDAFDEEGFFCTGDAVKWIDEQNPHLGLKFDGRTAEDFKLSTGTFVSVGPLRAKIINLGAPYVQDAVITGLNQKEVGAMIFTNNKIRQLAQVDSHAPLSEIYAHPGVISFFQNVIDQLGKQATGSATKIARAILLEEPASIDKGEITDKGSINQRAVLKHRDALVKSLHSDALPHIYKPSGK